MGGTGRTLLSLSLSSNFLSFSLLRPHRSLSKFPRPASVFLGFKPLCTATSSATGALIETSSPVQPLKHSLLLHKLRSRHLKDVSKTTERVAQNNNSKKTIVESFVELGLSEEVMMAVRELNISVPTEIQCLGIPSILEGNSVALGSHTGSGKTLAYLLPVVQLLRRDEAISGVLTKPRRPRAVVLCPTRELSEQVYHVAKSISHHARFRSTMVSGGGRSRPQEDSLNAPVDMVVGTPGRVLQHIEDRNIAYGDIKYLVLDEADTMFDHGFGPEIRKFLSPLKNRASKSNDPGFQTVLVAATMTKAVQKLIDEEFQGITHLRTSTVHKKIASARHDFIKLSGSENKLEVLLQVLEPSLAKGNKVMVFCNTLNSSRAVDHFLAENQVSTVNYHGEVPAEQRAENFEKFKSDDGDCPTLVCTDLAARGLDLAVDHVIMFDFPSSSIDYLHRSGRTARMGAKGKVTSLIAKRDFILASRIEEALRKNESLEAITVDRKVGSDDGAAMPRTAGRQKRKKFDSAKPADHRKKSLKPLRILDQKKGKKLDSAKFADPQKKSIKPPSFTGKVEYQQSKAPGGKSAKATAAAKSTRRTIQASGRSISKGGVSSAGKKLGQTNAGLKPTSSKLSVVGFRGRSSSSRKEESRPC